MKEFIFTFCLDGPPYPGGCFTAVKAPSYNEARELMVKAFGTSWAFQYESREEAGVDRFGLREIPFPMLEEEAEDGSDS